MNNTEKIYNAELINFISNVLLISDGIRSLSKKSDVIRVRIKALDYKKELIYEKGHNFAEELLNYVLFACQNSSYKYELVAIKSDTHGNDDSISIELNDPMKGLDFQSSSKFLNFKEIRSAVSSLFVAEGIKEDFNKKLNNYEDLLTSYIAKKCFINREEIKNYLLVYTDILAFLLENEELIKGVGKKEILKPFLNFCDVDQIKENDKSIGISLFSPISLYLLLIIYHKLDEYLQLEIKGDIKDFEAIYHEIFIKKVSHAYRWYLADEKNTLYHAAISPFVESRADDYQLMVPVHKLKTYNSFEGIRELRLAEKIIYELEFNQELYKEKKEYRIAILGDLQKEPVKELCEYLTKIIKNKISIIDSFDCQDIMIYLDIYTKTVYDEDRIGSTGNCLYEFCKWSDILVNKNELDKVLSTHQSLFILDNLDLYGDIYVEEYHNPEFYKQRLKYYNYKKIFEEICEQKDIIFGGVFKELHEMLTAYLYSGRWGELKKSANDVLLQYLEDHIYKSNERKMVYVYVSDLNAFHELYCNDKYFIRKEQYAGKEIGIIRYSQREEKILSNVEKDSCILVFNLWQFVKHIAIDKRNYFLEKLLPGVENIADLKQIHIGIKYRLWREELLFDYYLEKDLSQKQEIVCRVENFINDTLIPFFNETQDNMYNKYIQNSICSFLYSDVASVEDMLFVHLYKNHREMIGKAVLNGQHNPEQIKKHINPHFKYAFKRFYEMALESYDISASEYIGQYKTVEMIEKSKDFKRALQNYKERDMGRSTDAKNILFRQIMRACENLGYTGSYVYIRSKEEAGVK